MSGPSEKAVEAAQQGHIGKERTRVVACLSRAHDPALGLDRSVCARDFLRDVVAYLRRYDYADGAQTPEGRREVARAAEFIEREFGA